MVFFPRVSIGSLANLETHGGIICDDLLQYFALLVHAAFGRRRPMLGRRGSSNGPKPHRGRPMRHHIWKSFWSFYLSFIFFLFSYEILHVIVILKTTGVFC